MRLLVALALAVVGAWLVLRRRGGGDRRVIVAFEDGSELELEDGSTEHDRLVGVAREALRQ